MTGTANHRDPQIFRGQISIEIFDVGNQKCDRAEVAIKNTQDVNNVIKMSFRAPIFFPQ